MKNRNVSVWKVQVSDVQKIHVTSSRRSSHFHFTLSLAPKVGVNLSFNDSSHRAEIPVALLHKTLPETEGVLRARASLRETLPAGRGSMQPTMIAGHKTSLGSSADLD